MLVVFVKIASGRFTHGSKTNCKRVSTSLFSVLVHVSLLRVEQHARNQDHDNCKQLQETHANEGVCEQIFSH